MTDNRFIPPKSTLELLEAVPETVVITAAPFAQNPLDVAASLSQTARIIAR